MMGCLELGKIWCDMKLCMHHKILHSVKFFLIFYIDQFIDVFSFLSRGKSYSSARFLQEKVTRSIETSEDTFIQPIVVAPIICAWLQRLGVDLS